MNQRTHLFALLLLYVLLVAPEFSRANKEDNRETREHTHDNDQDDYLSSVELTNEGDVATLVASSNKATFGQRWLAGENSQRAAYYMNKAAQLCELITSILNEKEDEFLVSWELRNTVVAILELEPKNSISWMFAGEIAVFLLQTNDRPSQNDVVGFFARAAQLNPTEIPTDVVSYAVGRLAEDSSLDDDTKEVLLTIQRLFSSTDLPHIPRDSEAYLMVSSTKHARISDKLDAVERTRAIGGRGAFEPGDVVPEAEEPKKKTKKEPTVRGGVASQQTDRSAAQMLRPITLWPTQLATVNLLEVSNMTKEDNKLLSDLAIKHFLEFQTSFEKERREMGESPPTPNDLDDAFFSDQHANPAVVLDEQISSNISNQWHELYGMGTEGRVVYKRLLHAIRSSCEEYVKRYARPGTYETSKMNGFTEDFWSAVYIPTTVHSHHVHQMSVVSAVYYSKVSSENTPIVFSDPRGAGPVHNYEQFEGEHDFEPEGPFHQQYSYFPEEGELIIFPSWLVHKVPSHRGKGDRVSWPYNYKTGSDWDSWSRTVMV